MTTSAAETRFRPFGQLGLRARIVTTFTLGATLIAALLSITSVTLSRTNLLDQRERIVRERTVVNAATLADKITSPDVDAQSLFGSLPTAGKPSALIPAEGSSTELRSISLDARYGTSTIPVSLRELVTVDHEAGIMRYELNAPGPRGSAGS